jgi:hypothetical protein
MSTFDIPRTPTIADVISAFLARFASSKPEMPWYAGAVR